MVEPLFGVHLSVAALVLRIAIGGLFIIHGYPKLGAQQRKQSAEWMKSMGLPAGFILFGGIVEFFGGIAILLGVFTSVIASLFALWMLSTTWLAAGEDEEEVRGRLRTRHHTASRLACFGGNRRRHLLDRPLAPNLKTRAVVFRVCAPSDPHTEVQIRTPTPKKAQTITPLTRVQIQSSAQRDPPMKSLVECSLGWFFSSKAHVPQSLKCSTHGCVMLERVRK